MLIAEIIALSKAGTLTCSQVAEIFYSQPYTQDVEKKPGTNIDYAIPHPHMHVQEGFRLPATPPPSAQSVMLSNLHTSNFQRTKEFWERTDSHLFANPNGVGLYDGKHDNVRPPDPKDVEKRKAYDESEEVKAKAKAFADAEKLTGSSNFRMMDSRMADKTGHYNRRTGWPDTPAEGLVTVYKCKVPQFGKQPKLVPVPDQSKPYDIDPWNGSEHEAAVKTLVATTEAHCLSQKTKIVNIGQIKPGCIVCEEYKTEFKPAVSKSNPHSMFEDSESAVVSLTAVLLSEAGRMALEALIAGAGLDRSVSLAVQSRTSVAVLQAQMNATPDLWKAQHIQRVNEAKKKGDVLPPPPAPSSDHERRGQTVKLVDRVQILSPERVLTGKFSISSKNIVITNSTFSNYPAGHLMLVTHYPSATDIAGLAADKDRYEKMQGVFADVDMPKVLPVLTW